MDEWDLEKKNPEKCYEHCFSLIHDQYFKKKTTTLHEILSFFALPPPPKATKCIHKESFLR